MRFYCFIIFIALLWCSNKANAQFRLYEKGFDNYKEGRYNEAIATLSEYLTKTVRDKSIDVDVFYIRALSYYKQNNYAKAVEDFDEAILLDHPNKGNIYWFKAKCQLNLGNDALGDYDRAFKQLSSDKLATAKLLFERSQLYAKKGDLTAAHADLKAANDADPKNADVSKELQKIDKQYVASRGTQQEVKQTTPKEEKILKKENQKPTVKEPAPSTVTPKSEPQSKPVVIVKQQAPAVVPVAPTLADEYKDERRFALVIGNSNYPRQIGVLRNPVNDATDMAKELEKSNFKVQLLTNATYGQMRAAFLKFKEMVDASERDKTVSLFYYAGHGLQQESENYLVPIDASIEYEDDIPRYCFPVQRMVLANMERSNSRINIVILDACRNNPFPALTRSLGDQGLGEMKRARGAFIAYATAPGSVASDGNGRNGLYTQELIKAMQKPGRTIEQVFKDVRQNVLRISGDKQNTWDSSNIIGEFYFRF